MGKGAKDALRELAVEGELRLGKPEVSGDREADVLDGFLVLEDLGQLMLLCVCA